MANDFALKIYKTNAGETFLPSVSLELAREALQAFKDSGETIGRVTLFSSPDMLVQHFSGGDEKGPDVISILSVIETKENRS